MPTGLRLLDTGSEQSTMTLGSLRALGEPEVSEMKQDGKGATSRVKEPTGGLSPTLKVLDRLLQAKLLDPGDAQFVDGIRAILGLKLIVAFGNPANTKGATRLSCIALGRRKATVKLNRRGQIESGQSCPADRIRKQGVILIEVTRQERQALERLAGRYVIAESLASLRMLHELGIGHQKDFPGDFVVKDTQRLPSVLDPTEIKVISSGGAGGQSAELRG